MSTPYLTFTEFRILSVMRPEDVDLVEALYPGFFDGQEGLERNFLDSRLRKRYAVPFVAPVPPIIKRWLAWIITMAFWDRRGSGDSQQGTLERAQARYDKAMTEVKEAADATEGLFDLPLTDTSSASGVTQGFPLVHTEASPYVWADDQRKQASFEDSRGRGSNE